MCSSLTDPSITKLKLQAPDLDEVSAVLESSLKDVFGDVSVRVVDCPDLTKEPFYLAGQGLCGEPRITDLGGTPYLFPQPKLDKQYNLLDVPKWLDLALPVFMLGAGAAAGGLGELIANLKINKDSSKENQNHTVKVRDDEDLYYIDHRPNLEWAAHLINLFASHGEKGQVLEIKASKRKTDTDFISAIRNALEDEYGTKTVALGGVFLLKSGKAKIHVMPCYSGVPLTTAEEVKKWIHFYVMPAPLISLGYLVSHDPGLKLRMQHFHCFSKGDHGGHFHHDVTPESAEYIGYFNVAEFVYRVDMFDIDKSDALGM